MVSNAGVLYVRTDGSFLVPFAYEYQTYGGQEFIQFFGQGAVLRFAVKNEPFSAAVYNAFLAVKRLNNTHTVPYPLDRMSPLMKTKRYPCDPKLWPSG